MAEEVKSQEAAPVSAEAAAPAAKKNKKINRLTADEIKSKIEALEKTSMTHSVYYAQLLLRKKELGI